jgi:hypothetical protein
MKNLLRISIFLLSSFLFIRASKAQVLNVCQGDSLKLSTASFNIPGITSVEWFRNNVLVSTDTAFVIKESGVYTLRCTGTGACHSEFSQPLQVVVNSLTAVNDSTYTRPSTAINIKVLLNDIAICYPVDTQTLTIVQQSHFGNTTYIGGGIFNYNPHPGFIGIDTFYYVVNDVNGNHSNVAMVLISINTNTPLPLSMGEFNVAKVEEEAHLYWNTFSTGNASHFEIERSGDGRNFEYKGKVLAPANSNENISYNYWDKKTLTGKNYYRLKMVDLSGSAAYSEIRMVNFNNKNAVKAYPIPANDYITIEMDQSQSGIAHVLIVDSKGRAVIKQTVSSNLFTVDLRGIAAGAYYIKFSDNSNTVIGEAIKFNKIQ